VPPPSYLTSCTPTKSNFYLDTSLETVIREPALYKLLTFHNPNLISIFRRLGHLSKEYVQVQVSFTILLKLIFYGEGLLAPLPTPKQVDHFLSFVHGSLFNIFAATFHSWSPFLHLQPEDMPCCGDRDPPNMEIFVA
jgi:hypothetical protein